MSGLVYGSVCSGIEAATVAWHPLGWKPGFFSEIEAFPRAALAHHYPEVPLHGDFTTIQTGQYQPIDLLVGGTPCQSFSIAGLRGGLDDGRGNLALEYLRLADRLRPRWLVWENVPGVLSSNSGRDFGSILGGMVEIGYGFAYRVLDAQYFGLAQRRKRVFVIGYLGDWRPAAAVLFECNSLSGNPAPRREAGQRVADTLSVGANQCSGRPGDFTEHVAQIAPTLNANFGQKQGLDNQHIDGGGGCLLPPVAMCLNAGAMGRRDAESETLIPTNRCGEGGAQNSLHQDSELICFEKNLSLQFPQEGGPYPPLKRSTEAAIAFAQNTRNEVREMVISGALAAQPGMKQTSYIRQNTAVRRLTPTECERLQGFPDGYTAIPYRGKPADQCPDGPRYKGLGNSMAVPVMRWIGERIAAVESVAGQTEIAA